MYRLDGCVISWVKLCWNFEVIVSGEQIHGRIIAFHSWLVHLKKKLYVFELLVKHMYMWDGYVMFGVRVFVENTEF